VRLAPRLAVAVFSLGLAGTAACGGSPPATPSPLQGVLRPSQAPIVGLPDVFGEDSLLGKRVRVLGWCAWAPGLLAGRRIGAWFLASPDTMVEVRGAVPPACSPQVIRQALVLVFAQVVRATPDSASRLLLRLPD
jgi:hypothetical protein